MRHLKTIISLILIFSMLLVAVACNDGSDDTSETSQNSSETSEKTEESSKMPEGSSKTPDETTGKPEEEFKAPESIKILAIGNSFSDDAMAYLWDLLRAAGCKKVIVANLYIGGCTLDKHYSNIQNNTASYTYKKNTNGSFANTASSTIRYGLNDEEWDYITLQQASGSSGMRATYSHVNDILGIVQATNPQAKVYWHMTWAYQQNSTHADFAKYNKSQPTMYSAITNAATKEIQTNSRFVGIIPSGTTIQNLRTSFLGDTLTRDGYHMSHDFGRYSVGLTWVATILGEKAIDNITWVPSSHAMLSLHLNMIKESVHNAIKTPFSVTNSTYTVNSSASGSSGDNDILKSLNLDPAQYTPLLSASDWNKNAYYNSTSTSNWNVLNTSSNTTSENLKKFAATKFLTKQDIPVGSVIILDEGYTYRPEGWKSLTDKAQNTAKRQAEISTNVVIVTEAWWGNYTYRGFNLKKGDETYSSDAQFLDLISHLRIYVPKNT